MKGGEFVEYRNEYFSLKKDSSPWGLLPFGSGIAQSVK
jgi:hypothetical protein